MPDRGRIRYVEEQRYRANGLYVGSTIKQRKVRYNSELNREEVITYDSKRVPLIEGGVISKTEYPMVWYHYKIVV